MQEQKKVKKEQQSRQSLNDYAKYTGIAFQMIVLILLGVFFGKKMDKWFNTDNSLFTAIFSLLGVVLSIYSVIKDLVGKK